MFVISNILKTFLEASALPQGTSPILQRNMSNNKNITNNINNLNNSDIHPFHVNIPEDEIGELRRSINATRWPEKERKGLRTKALRIIISNKVIFNPFKNQ